MNLSAREMKPRLALLGVVFLLGSCAVGPEFRKPEMRLPDHWHRDESSPNRYNGKQSVHRLNDGWWDAFTDSDIKRILVRLREANPDLHLARARIDEALAQRGVNAGGGWLKTDKITRFDFGLGRFGSDEGVELKNNGESRQFHQQDLAWELDLFGARKRLVEGSTRQWESTIESWRDSLLFLTGEVVFRYTDIRVNQERLRLLRHNLSVYRQISDNTGAKESEGVVSKIEVKEAYARVKSVEAEIPRIEARVVIAKNRLARLLALFPHEIDSYLSPRARVPVVPRGMKAGVPAQTILSRPDVRHAERKIAAQVEAVGAVMTDVYPKLNLSGAITYELIKDGSTTDILRKTIGGGGTIVKRLFHAGADRSLIAEQEAKLEMEARTYESTIYTAIMETENALAELHFERRREARLYEAIAASKGAYDSLKEGFQDGLIDVRDLLRAQDELYALRLERLFAQNALAKAATRLYKCVGGGSIPAPPALLKSAEEKINYKKPTINLPALSRIFSINGDRSGTLHRRSYKDNNRSWNYDEKEGFLPRNSTR